MKSATPPWKVPPPHEKCDIPRCTVVYGDGGSEVYIGLWGQISSLLFGHGNTPTHTLDSTIAQTFDDEAQTRK